jgi:hypothetical protein
MAKKEEQEVFSIKDLMDNIPQHIKDKVDKQMADLDAYHDARPDHSERYATDKSYWLEEIKKAGFNPVGITVMACEETIIMKTQEELDSAWAEFGPEGWWYTEESFVDARKKYVDDCYGGDETKAPKVYNLN